MDPHPTPFPGKHRATKLKSNKNASDPSKMNTKEQGPPILRQKRLFGTARNPNITSKPLPEKPIKKPSSVVLKMAAKPLQITQSKNEKKSTEQNGTQLRKKTVRFHEKGNFKNEGNLVERDVLEPQTPVRTPCVVKTRPLGTPYHTAERCSKCRGDRLETSLYWVGQIKLAESVGKHFVSAGFFRLVLESKAEPFATYESSFKNIWHDVGTYLRKKNGETCVLIMGYFRRKAILVRKMGGHVQIKSKQVYKTKKGR